jgi:MFS family permease
MQEINKNPVCKNIFIAGFLRTMGSMIVTAFVPVFFQKVFPAFKSQYAVINAAALTLFGFSSALIGGMLSDKFEKKSYMTKSAIIMAGHFLAVPLTAIACFSNNFWLAIACFAAKIFVSGSYYAPAITMMQNSTDPSNSGFVVSAYTFYAYLAQTLAPLIFGYFANSLGAIGNPRMYGYLVTSAVTLGYLGSNIFYYRAGKEYTKMMQRRD